MEVVASGGTASAWLLCMVEMGSSADDLEFNQWGATARRLFSKAQAIEDVSH